MSKIIYFFLIFVSIFCISDIISNLTSINFNTDERLLASSVDELLKKNVSVCFNELPLILEDLRKSTTHDVQELFKRVTQDCPEQLGVNEVMISTDLVCERKLFSYLQRGINNFQIVDQNLPTLIYAIGFNLNSPFKKIFAEVDARIKESGLDLKWETDWKVTKIEEKGIEIENDSEVMALVLPYIVGIGCLLAFIVLLLEIIHHRIKIYNDIADNSNYYSSRNCLQLFAFVLNFSGLRRQVIRMWKQCVKVAKFLWFKVKRTRV